MTAAPFPSGAAYALPDGRIGDPRWEVTPLQVKAAQESAAGECPVILDVREADEIATASLDGALTIPMGEVKARLAEIEAAADRGPIVAMCHGGVRSMQVAVFLRQEAGIEEVWSMAGGIDAWSAQVDPGIPRY